jgi:adhesin transport system outer membrane protein
MAVPAVVHAATFESELAGLVASNPQIQAAENNLLAAGSGVGVARAGYLPSVRVTADNGPEHSNGAESNQSHNGQPLTEGGSGAGVLVTQHLFDGYATDSAVDQAKDSQRVAEASLRSVRQNLTFEGISAYLDVMRQTRLVMLAQNNERRLQTALNLEDERVQRGSGMAVDVLSAKHRLQIAKERRITFEGAQRAAVNHYMELFGHAPTDLPTGDAPAPRPDIIPATLEDAVRVAENENPDVVSGKLGVLVANDRTEVARSGYYPTLDFVTKYDYGNNRDGNIGTSRDWQAIVQLTWDLSAPVRARSAVSQAAYDSAASKSNAGEAQHKAQEAAQQAWSQLMITRERIDLLTNAVSLADEVLAARTKMRAAGKATVLEVLDAESDVTSAQINLEGVNFDMRLAAFQLLRAMGRLDLKTLAGSGGSNAPAPAAK